jgi:hypothetical protein
LDTRPDADAVVSGLPELLTVEEAARLIRVGRTKAYAMTQQWRATNGQSGLPVVDFGDVLRVPRRALEELLGVELHGDLATPSIVDAPAAPAVPTAAGDAAASPAPRRRPSRDRNTRRETGPADQLDLFDATGSPSRP